MLQVHYEADNFKSNPNNAADRNRMVKSLPPCLNTHPQTHYFPGNRLREMHIWEAGARYLNLPLMFRISIRLISLHPHTNMHTLFSRCDSLDSNKSTNIGLLYTNNLSKKISLNLLTNPFHYSCVHIIGLYIKWIFQHIFMLL